ncbi:MAG: holo-ACP synthase [Polyangiaceae bacterium]
MPIEDSRATKGDELGNHDGWQPLRSGRLLGVDLMPVSHVAHALHHFGDRYLNRVYTRAEIDSCPSLAAAHFAGRFAAKEAAFKALHGGDETSSSDARNEPFDWRTIEVLRRPDGSPSLRLHGRMRALAERRGVRHLDLSLSHDGDYAIAFVVGEAASPGDCNRS